MSLAKRLKIDVLHLKIAWTLSGSHMLAQGEMIRPDLFEGDTSKVEDSTDE